MEDRHGGRIEPHPWPSRPLPEQTMPPTPRRKPRSCVEILDQLGEKASWDDYLARLAAAAEEETEAAVEAPAADQARLTACEAKQIADLRRRLDLG
jgi:hypothetical protein